MLDSELEDALAAWGRYRLMMDGMPWHQAETRAKECEHIVFLESETVSLNATERNGGAMSRFSSRFPLEARINIIVRDHLTLEQRRVLSLRYLSVSKSGKPVGTRTIARIYGCLSDKQVRQRLSKAQEIVKNMLEKKK